MMRCILGFRVDLLDLEESDHALEAAEPHF
jgi:hypothetical protein